VFEEVFGDNCGLPISYGNNCVGSPPLCTLIANPNFGIPTSELTGRVIELEGRFVL
jgi:hypothetical protein